MAEQNPPQWLQGGSHPANLDRLLTQTLVAVEGVVLDGDLLVSERAAGANMSVDVAAGSAFVEGTESAHQGIYHVYNDAVVNLTIAAADATNDRIDLVVAQVRDAFYSGTDNDWRLFVVTGTPAATPAEPDVPDNSLVLARVDVTAAASSITDADITDRRDEAGLSDLGQPWQDFTPTWTNLTIGDGTQTARYQQIGNTVHVQVQVTFGSTTDVTGNIALDPPVTPIRSYTVNYPLGLASYREAGVTTYYGPAVHIANVIRLLAGDTSGSQLQANSVAAALPFSWGEGDEININLTYEVA